jgi:hypothetical protein
VCLSRRPVVEANPPTGIGGGKRRETRVACGYHATPLSSSTPGGEKKENEGGV